MYQPRGGGQQTEPSTSATVDPPSHGDRPGVLQVDPASPDSLGGLAPSDDSEPSSTMFVQRNLIKQLQRLVRQQSSRIEELQSDVQRLQHGNRATDIMYLERLQNQQQRLDERQDELARVRKEAETFRHEIDHLRSVMGGLENEADEREKMFSQVYSLERETIDRDRSKKAEALTRLEQQKHQLASENAAHVSRLQATEAELSRVCRALQEEQRHLQSSRQDAESARQEKLQLLEELKREQQEREAVEERHRDELRSMELQLARSRQERMDDRVELSSQVTELEVKNSVLESQVQRLEMQLIDGRTQADAASPTRPPPASAVLMQLTRSEEEVQRLRQQLEGLEVQKRQYFAQLGELETRLSSQIQESKRAAQEGAAVREQRAGLEKAVKALGTEVEILKDDLHRAREKNAGLEHGLLEVRLQWQKDKALATERDQEASLKVRSLEQQVEELSSALEMKCRELTKVQDSHSDLQNKCSKLSLSKNGAVNDLMATMAAHEERHQQEQEQLQGQLEASKQLARDLQEELETVRADGKAQAERAARGAESQRKEVHDLTLEVGRLRAKVEEKRWEVQKLESTLAEVRQQHGEEAEGGGGSGGFATQQLKESLEAAKREIEKLRRERDGAGREAREAEQRLRAEVSELRSRLDEVSFRESSERRRRRCESALAALGGAEQAMGLSVGEDEDGSGGGVMGLDALLIAAGGGQQHELPSPLRSLAPAEMPRPNPWASVARLLGGQASAGTLNASLAAADLGLSGQQWLLPRHEGSGLSHESQQQGCVAREGETVHGAGFVRPARHSWDPATLRTDPTSRFYSNTSGPPSSTDSGRGPLRPTASSRGREVLARQWRVSEAGAAGGGSPLRRSRDRLVNAQHASRGGAEDQHQEDSSPEAQDMAGDRHGFGSWSGLPTGDTDDSFLCVGTDVRAAPPLEPPVPPLPSITSQHRHHQDDHESDAGDGSVAGTSITGSVSQSKPAKKQRRPGTSEGRARRSSTTSTGSSGKRSRSGLKNHAPLVSSGAVAAAKLRRAVASPAVQQGRAGLRRASTTTTTSSSTSSRPGSGGGRSAASTSVTPRGAGTQPANKPAKPATAAAVSRAGTAARKSSSSSKAGRLPRVVA